ncbi:hypothetical protein FH972_023610 [Carpinus fangiana]|uniref:BZIP domain-containing protein n=1 Tax=Carpinus fangiana TaxID=176857 RepID=A0A5N6KW21_9ROSI|nr:hypothetical protein FH972_023610 [Carpinus fangiana]
METAMTVMNADQQHDVVPQIHLDGGMPWDFSANVVDESFSFGIDNLPHGNALVESPSNLNEEFEAFDDASEEGQLLAALSNESSTLHNQQYCPATAVPTVDANIPRHLQTLSTPAVSFQDPWSIHRSQYPSDAAVPSVGVKTLRNREAAERSRNKIKNEVTDLRVECQQQKEQLEAQARHIAMLEQQLQQCGVHVSPFAGQVTLDG